MIPFQLSLSKPGVVAMQLSSVAEGRVVARIPEHQSHQVPICSLDTQHRNIMVHRAIRIWAQPKTTISWKSSIHREATPRMTVTNLRRPLAGNGQTQQLIHSAHQRSDIVLRPIAPDRINPPVSNRFCRNHRATVCVRHVQQHLLRSQAVLIQRDIQQHVPQSIRDFNQVQRDHRHATALGISQHQSPCVKIHQGPL